jgi:phosphate acetyltransferase
MILKGRGRNGCRRDQHHGRHAAPGTADYQKAKGISVVSAALLWEVPNKAYGENVCCVRRLRGEPLAPRAEQLAAIAVSSAQTAKSLCGMEPRVAMLSFSTKGKRQARACG